MSSFVILISFLSLVSSIYSCNILGHEIHNFRLATQPFGGGLEHMAEQVLRLSLAVMLLSFSLIFISMSAALIWLSQQPTMVG